MGDSGADEGNGVEVFELDFGAELLPADRADGHVGVAAHLALFHVAVGNTAVDHDQPEGGEKGERLLRAVQRRLRDDLHERGAGAVVIDERFAAGVVQLADILLEVDARQRNPPVLAEEVARGAGQLDFHGASRADRLVVLRNLVVLRAVGIKVVLAVPFADRRDLTAEHQADFDDAVEGGLVHHR